MFATKLAMDRCHFVLDVGALSNAVADLFHARATPSYPMECRIGVGLGIGYLVSDSDFVGACAFEVGEGVKYVGLFRKKSAKR